MGKGSRKGGTGSGSNGSKGSFQGICFHCGAQGRRISECRKKAAEMKERASADSRAQAGDPITPVRERARAHGPLQKRVLELRQGTMGRGGTWAYGLDNYWSGGNSWQSDSIAEDTALFQLAMEARS